MKLGQIIAEIEEIEPLGIPSGEMLRIEGEIRSGGVGKVKIIRSTISFIEVSVEMIQDEGDPYAEFNPMEARFTHGPETKRYGWNGREFAYRGMVPRGII